MIRTAERKIELSGEIVMVKTLVSSILHTCDSEGRLNKKMYEYSSAVCRGQ